MGNVIGIVAEYNPFHNGHARLIEQTRARLGADCPVVCVMSGDFVQRGSPAVYAKFARAEAAARCGADLVLELPLPWALSSAEGFARGAVGLLGSLGVVTHLSFGSECGELEPLQRVAEALLDPLLGEDLRAELQAGIPFAAARQQAVARRVGALAELLQAPNNILAVEYLKAIFDQRLDLHPLTILRTGAQHDRPAEGNVRSASELRTRIGAGRMCPPFCRGRRRRSVPGKRRSVAGRCCRRRWRAQSSRACACCRRRLTTRCPARPRGWATVCTAPRTRSRRSTAYSRRQNPSATRSRASGA